MNGKGCLIWAWTSWMLFIKIFLLCWQGSNNGWQGGHNSPGVESLYGGRKTVGMPKNRYNITSSFFCTVLLFPKDLVVRTSGAKLSSCPGRHLTSLCSWMLDVDITELMLLPSSNYS